jgi:hypothetical protein
VVPVIGLATILLGVAIAVVEDEVEEVLLAAAAGAAGAALGDYSGSGTTSGWAPRSASS